MNSLELHCHTTLSDGRDSTDVLVQKAQAQWLGLVAVTDHDRINIRATEALRAAGIQSPYAVEISAKDYEWDHSLHILYYMRQVPKKLSAILEGVLEARRDKIRKQCEQLAKHGFEISYDALVAYAQSLGIEDNLNNGTIAFFLLESEVNKQKASEYCHVSLSHMQQVIDAFLKETSDYPGVGWVQIGDYEPSLETLVAIAQENGGILSVAHPNFSYERRGGIEAFEKAFARFRELWIHALEYNALATPEWEASIRRMAQRTDAILTLWSDYHGDRNKRHGAFGTIHPNAEEYLIEEHRNRFCVAVFGE